MEPGFFTSRHFAVSATVAVLILAGAATAWSVGIERGSFVYRDVCDAPPLLGTTIPTTPATQRERDGTRAVTSVSVDPTGTTGGIAFACAAVGEIEISASPDEQAHLTIRVTGEADAVEQTIVESRFGRLDDQLVAQVWVVQQTTSGSFFGGRQGTSVTLVLQLPATGAYDVEAVIDVGDASVKDLMVGELHLAVDVGDAKALGIDLAGNAAISTDVGGIILAADSVQSGAIHLSSDVNDIEVRLPQRADIGYEVVAATDVGSVTVQVGETEIDDHASEGPSESSHVRTAGFATKPTQVRIDATADVGSISVVAQDGASSR